MPSSPDLNLYGLALEVGGRAALHSMRRSPLSSELSAFFAAQISAFLKRELPALEWEVQVRDNFFTLSWLEGGRRVEWLQLRFSPLFCRWFLWQRGAFKVLPQQHPRRWYPQRPERPCLSLGDWLGQIRKLLTLRERSKLYI